MTHKDITLTTSISLTAPMHLRKETSWFSIQRNEANRLPIEWEKIFTNAMSNKGLISKTYKVQITQYQKTKQPNFKQWTRDVTRQVSFPKKTWHGHQFSCSFMSTSLWPHEPQHTRSPCPSPLPESTQTHVHGVGDAIQPSHPLSSPSLPALNQHIAIGHIKRCSTSLITGEMQIKTMISYHITPVRMAINKKTILSRIWRKGNLYTLGENINWYSHFGKQYGDSSKH